MQIEQKITQYVKEHAPEYAVHQPTGSPLACSALVYAQQESAQSPSRLNHFSATAFSGEQPCDPRCQMCFSLSSAKENYSCSRCGARLCGFLCSEKHRARCYGAVRQ